MGERPWRRRRLRPGLAVGGALRRLGLVGTPHIAGSGSEPQRRALAPGRAGPSAELSSGTQVGEQRDEELGGPRSPSVREGRGLLVRLGSPCVLGAGVGIRFPECLCPD